MAKTLAIYYSAQGHTKRAAEIIAKTLDADLFEVQLEKPYTKEDLDWTNPNSRCNQKWEGKADRDDELKNTEVPNWADYDTVVVGYPIWYGVAAFPAASFIKSQDFSGKIVVPFCTSHSSELGDSDIKLKDVASGGEWQSGQRFFQDAPEKEIADWASNIK